MFTCNRIVIRVCALPGNLDIDLAIVILRQVIEPPVVDVSAKSGCSFFLIRLNTLFGKYAVLRKSEDIVLLRGIINIRQIKRK